jgi:carboxyl-terminal processing protease
MALTESTHRAVVEKSIRLLETKCIRFNGAQPNWRGLFSEHMNELARCESEGDFEATFNRVLARGGLSHVAFFHETAQHAPARYAINATFCASDTRDGKRWVFEDVHDGGPTHVAGVRPGDVLLEINGESIEPPKVATFGLGTDPLLKIRNGAGEISHVKLFLPKAPQDGKAHSKPPMAEPTSVTARSIGPDTGYLRVAFFPGVNGQRFARALDTALHELPGCTKLIIDLRGNLGGFVGSLRLMSYLTPDRMPIGYSLTKRGEDHRWSPERLPCIDRLPATKMDIIKMAIRFKVLNRDRSIRLVTEGLGAQAFHGHVVLLVNEHTLSAGEMVAAFAKENGLATIVGTTTGGQVLGGANFSVGNGFILRLPAAGWYTWRGAIVEGRGVAPDIHVSLSLAGLRERRDNQLEVAVATLNPDLVRAGVS